VPSAACGQRHPWRLKIKSSLEQTGAPDRLNKRSRWCAVQPPQESADSRISRSCMKLRTMNTRRKMCLVMLALAGTIVVGYSSAAVSLNRCDAHIRPWLANGFPEGDFVTQHYSEPSTLFIPFVVKTRFVRKWHSPDSDYGPWYKEEGTRYYFTLFGLAVPIWSSSETDHLVA
jgi:hypothetical protein